MKITPKKMASLSDELYRCVQGNGHVLAIGVADKPASLLIYTRKKNKKLAETYKDGFKGVPVKVVVMGSVKPA